MPNAGGTPGASVAPKTAVKGKTYTFASGTVHGTGTTVKGFKGKVARRGADGRLMVNAGTNAKPKWVETHERHIQAPAKKPAATADGTRLGDNKRTYKERLSPEEYKAILDYQGEYYKGINGALRSGKEPGKPTAKRIAGLDSAVKKGVIEQDTNLYRAFHFPGQDPKSLVGKEFTDKGFVSTSEKTTLPGRMASSQKGAIFARIKTPAGTNVAYIHKANNGQSTSKYGRVPEFEVLLGRGSKFRVVKASQNKDGVWNMDLELVTA